MQPEKDLDASIVSVDGAAGDFALDFDAVVAAVVVCLDVVALVAPFAVVAAAVEVVDAAVDADLLVAVAHHPHLGFGYLEQLSV